VRWGAAWLATAVGLGVIGDGRIFQNGGTTLTDSASLASALSDESGTGAACFVDSPTFTDDITIGAAGVKLTGSDGTLALLGLGNGFDHELTIDLDNTNGYVTFNATGSAAYQLKIGGTTQYVFDASIFDIDGATIALDADADTYIVNNIDDTFRLVINNAEALKLDASGLETLKLEAGDLTAGACTANTVRLDTTGTRELCICNTGGTAYDCWSATTANGPSD
jgi:hypothetical protein